MAIYKHILYLFLMLVLFGCKKTKNDTTTSEALQLSHYTITPDLVLGKYLSTNPTLYFYFNQPILSNTIENGITITVNGQKQTFSSSLENNDSTLKITIQNLSPLQNTIITLNSTLQSKTKQTLPSNLIYNYKTTLQEKQSFPTISDEDLLTLVEKQTFTYFWDAAHPTSGMILERLGSGNTVTTGGTGFGLMCLLIGMERGFISPIEGTDRIQKIVNFLKNKTTRYHGAWPHWLNGQTGETIPFSTYDNGADLIETAFLIQGLLTVKEYLKEKNLLSQTQQDIQQLSEDVEWTWFQQNGQKVLYWHWSPNYEWRMNLPIRGWNEGLIAYVLAASSPTYAISRDVYEQGWAKSGNMRNGKNFYNILLPLGEDYGGPLFFAHYSFLGLDPRKLQDQYANYWEQNVAHASINQQYAKTNPKKYYPYGDSCWGLTASDDNTGYEAHSPLNDKGVITPTAALASFPYTPEASMKALHFFYYNMGNYLFKDYGFVDAFNLNANWVASSFLAIDQGPIMIMIENYRTQLLWNYFMKNTDIQAGLTKLGFTYK